MTTNRIIPILKVSSILGINLQNARTDTVRARECPFCGSHTAFSMSLESNTWHCFACGEKGNSITLFSKVKGVTNKEAYKELQTLSEEKVTEPEEEKPHQTAKRFDAYAHLLDNLKLSKDHRDNLLTRGLTDEEVVKLNYKTLDIPAMSYDGRDALAQKVADASEKLSEFERIPGFYDFNTDNPKIAWQPRGILIPVRNIRREIEGFQIRHDSLPDNATKQQKEMFHRYGWFTSGDKKTGIRVSGIGNIHHAGNWYYLTQVSDVYITEGALKSDVASAILDRMQPNKQHLFLGLTGVQNVSQLENELKLLANFNLKKVNLCVDMDYLTNKNVQKALENIKKIITGVCYKDINGNEIPLTCSVVNWNPEYKGIDDFLQARWLLQHQN